MPLALRDNEHARGRPGLSVRDQAKVTKSNRIVDRGGQLIALRRRCGVLGGEENPATSSLWSFPSRLRLLASPSTAQAVVDYCSFGLPFRARARLMFWGHKPSSTWASQVGKGRGLRDFSGKAHVALTGSAGGAFRTKQKSAYPLGAC